MGLIPNQVKDGKRQNWVHKDQGGHGIKVLNFTSHGGPKYAWNNGSLAAYTPVPRAAPPRGTGKTAEAFEAFHFG